MINLNDTVKQYLKKYDTIVNNSELARKILKEKKLDETKFHNLRKLISRVRLENENINITKNDDGPKYIVSNDTYIWKGKKGEIILTVKEADRLFYEYSEHGLNMSQTQLINKYGFEIWQWNSIKNTLGLYKKSNIFSPYTLENTPKEEREGLIEALMEEALTDRVNVENVYNKVVLKNAKKIIATDNVRLLSEQKLLSDLFDIIPEINWHNISLPRTTQSKNRPINVFIADLHNGAKVEFMHLTPDFSPEILKNMMDRIAERINKFNSSNVTLSFLGDLIESFTGLNHKNSWQQMEEGYYGAKVVKETVELLLNFISKVNNVTQILGIGGNHDRGDSDSKIDYKGEIAGIIFYILQKTLPKEISIDFDFDLVSKEVDGIQYLIMHGHNKEVNQSAEKLILDYGKQGMYNLIITGHLHSLKIKTEGSNHRQVVCPSVFGGNTYSERNGWISTPGFITCYNNGYNKPEMIITPLN